MAGLVKRPVIIGVGEIRNKSTHVDDAEEPMSLMLKAIDAALHDTGLRKDHQLRLQQRIDSIDVVKPWSWPYSDLPGLIGNNLGVELMHKRISIHGGHSPVLMLHESSARVTDGSCSVAVVTGGEALASVLALYRNGIVNPRGWTARPPSAKSRFDLMMEGKTEPDSIAAKHHGGKPIHVYPMYENSLRARRSQTYQQNITESAELYAQFAQIAAEHPTAWTHKETPISVRELQQIRNKNRMICFPYPLFMNAFNNVNQASACIVTNTEVAVELGVPEENWIYPAGAAGFEEKDEFWLRSNYYSSPALSKTIDTAISMAGVEKNQIDVLDIYSCFPIVPKLACQHMGLSITEPSIPITLLGGLTSFGGAGNNYSGHAVVAMVRELRQGQKRLGLVLANGGVLTHQNAIVLSKDLPQKVGLPLDQAYHAPLESTIPPFDEKVEGEAIIETYTVEFHRNGRPMRGHIIGTLLKNQHRFIANHGDSFTLAELTSPTLEPVGRKGFVSANKDGLNLFSLGTRSSL